MPHLLDHIDLRVPDLAAASSFYEVLLPALGFPLRVEIEGWLQFEAPGDGPTDFFGITEDPAHRPNATRIAFRAESREQLDALAALLTRIGARNIEGPGFEAPDYYAVYFEDPFGNRLEICHRTRRLGAA
jgi:catechol 2,3-dioxygenase-like lactoylglutathione lyase family enzyme